MEFVWFLIASIVSTIIFDILFQAINLSMLKLFVSLQKITNKSKKRNIYKNISLLILIVINTFIKESFDLSYIWYGVMLGFFSSLNRIIFPVEKREKKQSIELKRVK